MKADKVVEIDKRDRIDAVEVKNEKEHLFDDLSSDSSDSSVP